MKDRKDIDPRETLRRLAEFLDEDPPTDEEARAECEAMGVDIDAMAAHIRAMVAAHEAGLLVKEPPPQSLVRVRRARAPGVRHRVRR